MMSIFSNNTKRLRQQLNITQVQLAKECGGITRNTIAQWETGRAEPTLKHLIVLTGIFGVTLNQLVFKIDAQTKNHQRQGIKNDLVAAWQAVEKNQQMKERFNSWSINERVEFLLTIDSLISEKAEGSTRDKELMKILMESDNANIKPPREKANRIIKKPARRKREKQN